MIEFGPMTYTDIPEVINLGLQLHKESVHSKWEYDEAFTMDLVGKVLLDVEHETFHSDLAKEDGKIIGMLFGLQYSPAFVKAKVAADIMLYVIPEKRNGTLALKLIRTFEKWARYHKLSGIQLGTTTGINSERTSKFYNRLGYNYSNYILTKDL